MALQSFDFDVLSSATPLADKQVRHGVRGKEAAPEQAKWPGDSDEQVIQLKKQQLVHWSFGYSNVTHSYVIADRRVLIVVEQQNTHSYQGESHSAEVEGQLLKNQSDFWAKNFKKPK